MTIHPVSCTVCRRANAPWRHHCGGCGSWLVGSHACGFVNGADDRFCGGCGKSVRAAAPLQPARPEPPRKPPAREGTTKLDVLDDVLISEALIG